MPVLPEHAIMLATFEDTTLAKPVGSGPYVVSTSIRARASHSSAIPTIGAKPFRSIAACGISQNCVLIIIATPMPISKHSKPVSTKCVPSSDPQPLANRLRLSRGARRSCRQRIVSLRLAQDRLGLSSSIPGGQSFPHPCARGDFTLVRCRMGQPQFLLRSLPAKRELLRRFTNCRRTIARPTNANVPY